MLKVCFRFSFALRLKSLLKFLNIFFLFATSVFLSSYSMYLGNNSAWGKFITVTYFRWVRKFTSSLSGHFPKLLFFNHKRHVIQCIRHLKLRNTPIFILSYSVIALLLPPHFQNRFTFLNLQSFFFASQ